MFYHWSKGCTIGQNLIKVGCCTLRKTEGKNFSYVNQFCSLGVGRAMSVCSSKGLAVNFRNILTARFPITSSGLVVTKLSNLTFSHEKNSFVQNAYEAGHYFRQEHGGCVQWLSSENVHFQTVRKHRRHARRQFLNKLQPVKCEVRQVTF